MAGIKYIFGGLSLFALAWYLGQHPEAPMNAITAMRQVTSEASQCVEDRMVYRDHVMSCDVPLAPADIRKLDLRADNRSRSNGSSQSIVQINGGGSTRSNGSSPRIVQINP